MYVVMYRYKGSSKWRVQPEPFDKKLDAGNMCRDLLSYSASKAQQEYAAAVAVWVDPT